MGYRIANPSGNLSKFIKHYWTIDSFIPLDQNHVQRIVPSGLPELIFYFGDRPVSMDETRSISENSIITGHQSKYYDLKVSGRLSLFSVLFRPHGIGMFFDIPLHELCNLNVPLRYISDNRAIELESRLHETETFEGRIKTVENYFLNLLTKSRNMHHYRRIGQSIDLINQTRGNVSIDDLSSQACYSRKQFERVFLHQIGTSPKQFLKTIRFQHAIDLKSKIKSTNLTNLSYICGYYDQSHMINDFRRLSGFSPKQYFAECEPFSDYFQ